MIFKKKKTANVEKNSKDILNEIKRKKSLLETIDKKLSKLSKREKIYLLGTPFLLFGFISYYYIFPYTNDSFQRAEKYFKSVQQDIVSSKNIVHQYQVLIAENKKTNTMLVQEINSKNKDLLVLTDIAKLMNFLKIHQIYLENNLYNAFLLMDELGIGLNSLTINNIEVPLKEIKKSKAEVISFALSNSNKKVEINNNKKHKEKVSALIAPQYKNYSLKYDLNFVLNGKYSDILKFVHFWENKKELVLTKDFSYNPDKKEWNINIQIYSLNDKGIK